MAQLQGTLWSLSLYCVALILILLLLSLCRLWYYRRNDEFICRYLPAAECGPRGVSLPNHLLSHADIHHLLIEGKLILRLAILRETKQQEEQDESEEISETPLSSDGRSTEANSPIQPSCLSIRTVVL